MGELGKMLAAVGGGVKYVSGTVNGSGRKTITIPAAKGKKNILIYTRNAPGSMDAQIMYVFAVNGTCDGMEIYYHADPYATGGAYDAEEGLYTAKGNRDFASNRTYHYFAW